MAINYRTVECVLVLVGIILSFHQLVQPIFSPVIKSLSIYTIHIQSQIETPDSGLVKNYYRIFKIVYIIKPVLFFESNLTIRLPQDVEFFTPLSGFYEKNPYSDLIGPPQTLSSNFLDSNKYSTLSFHIKTTGFQVEEFPLTLVFREKINLECSNLVFSNEKWWSATNITPGEIPKIECFTKRLAMGKVIENGIVFSFDELIVRNRGELEVRGFLADIPLGNSPQIVVCENKRELTTIDYEINHTAIILKYSSISLDLQPGETRRMIILKQAPEYFENFENTIFPSEWKIFNFTSPYCGADWNNFIQ